jgi:hypothetical protein
LTSVRAGGATTLALAAAREACREGHALIVVDRERVFYPPAVVRLGMDVQRMIVVRPDNKEDENWAIDQALRCEGVGAVLCWPRKLDDHTFRRWQLAAEQSGVLGLLVRPRNAEREPSWADLRLRVSPCSMAGSRGAGRRLRIDVLRCHGATIEGAIELEIDTSLHGQRQEHSHETHRLPLAAALAPATTPAGSSGIGQPAGGHL